MIRLISEFSPLMRYLALVLSSLPFILTACGDSGDQPPERRTWSFPAEGVRKVIVRAARAKSAVIKVSPGEQIQLSGIPTLVANGYHAPDPQGRATPAREWTFDIAASREGEMLILTAQGETVFRDHRYVLGTIEVLAPPGITVHRETQVPATAQPSSGG